MADLTEKEIMKLKKMKAVLGDDASQKVLENAAAREAAAQAAGVQLKETDPEKPKSKTRTKAAPAPVKEEVDEAEPTSLAALLQQLEAGLEDGTIVDDVSETDETDETPEDPEEGQDLRTALKEVVAEVFDEKFAAFFQQMTLKEKAADPQVAALQAKLKETETTQKALKSQLDELLGLQPKGKPHRASQADETVVKESERPAGPAPDPVSHFINEFVLPGTNGNGNGVVLPPTSR